MASFVDSQKGAKKLEYEGHLYQKHFVRGDNIYWRCDQYKVTGCVGRAKTTTMNEGTLVELGNQHNHGPSPNRCEAWRINRSIRSTAIYSFGNAPRTVTNECIAGASDATIAALPNIESMEKAVRRTRAQQNILRIPKTLQEIEIPPKLQLNVRGANFLMYDSEAADPQRIFIFASQLDCARLSQCHTWFADGTFRSAPSMFLQLWVIHGLYRGRVLPFIFCLLPNKQQQTYNRALGRILANLPTRPTTIVIDFEKQHIPNVVIHGCYFHFSQAVWRKAQQLGFKQRYLEDERYRILIKMFTALTFCLPCDIIARFNSLAENFIQYAGNEEPHLRFLNYFEETWIGRPGRPPLFSVPMWNNNAITFLDLPRTTNNVESWHHQLQSKFNSPHPNIYKFIEGIREETVRTNAICVKLDGGEEVPLYSRKEYQEANQRLLNLLQRYRTMDAESFLKATSYYIKYRGADPIEEDDNEEMMEAEMEQCEF